MTIRVVIDHLILDGLPIQSDQGPAVRRAVEAELARLLAAGGVGLTGEAVDRVRGGDVQVGRNGNPADLGRQIAGAVYRGVR